MSDLDLDELISGCREGNIQKVKELIKGGVDINITNKYRENALEVSIEEGNLELVKLLITAGVDVAGKDTGTTALIIASSDGHTEIVKLLIAAGVDVNITNSYGRNPFSYAAENGNADIVKLLIAVGADVNNKSSDGGGTTGLMEASGHTDVIKLLLESGADPNIQSNYGYTALMNAVYENEDPEIIKLLIKAGADPNIQDKEGVTALLEAARHDNRAVIKLLIESGADPTIKANGVRAPIDDPLIQQIYSEYIVSQVKKLHAKQRLAFATMLIDEKHDDKPEEIIFNILKALEIPDAANRPLLDKTNELLKRSLQQELSKEIESSLKKKFSGEKLDDMIEFYREQLRKPGLPKKIRKAYKKQKRTRKNKMGVTLGSSDVSSISKSKSKSESKSKSKSPKSKTTKSQSKQSGKSKKYCPPEKVQECVSQGKVCNEFTGRCMNSPSDHFGLTKMFKDPPGYQGSKKKKYRKKSKKKSKMRLR